MQSGPRMCPELQNGSPVKNLCTDDAVDTLLDFAVTPRLSSLSSSFYPLLDFSVSSSPVFGRVLDVSPEPLDTTAHSSSSAKLPDVGPSRTRRRDPFEQRLEEFDQGANPLNRFEIEDRVVEMPRVVENQREKFNSDPVFRRLSRETEVRYAGCPLERPIDQRRRQFETDLDRGFLVMSVLSSGIHLMLSFRSPRNVPESSSSQADVPLAEIRNNQLILQSRLILNGVCVTWTGSIDMETLDGVGRVEFDAATAEREHIAVFGPRRTA